MLLHVAAVRCSRSASPSYIYSCKKTYLIRLNSYLFITFRPNWIYCIRMVFSLYSYGRKWEFFKVLFPINFMVCLPCSMRVVVGEYNVKLYIECKTHTLIFVKHNQCIGVETCTRLPSMTVRDRHFSDDPSSRPKP